MDKDNPKMFMENESTINSSKTKDIYNEINMYDEINTKFFDENEEKKKRQIINSDNYIKALKKLNKSNVKKKSYTLELKIKVVEFINQFKDQGKHVLADARKKIITDLGIGKTVISDWEKNYVNFKDEINMKRKRVIGGGRKGKFEDVEKDIIIWIIKNRKEGLAINIRSIIAYIYSLDQSYQTIPTELLSQRIRRLLKRNHLAIKKASHIGQPLPVEADDLINNFISEVVNKKCYLGINDSQLNRIVNIDETPIFFENPDTKTVDIKGNKEVIINTDGNENRRISVVLTVCSDGSKLSPYCIFEGEKEKRTEKELNDLEIIKSKKMFAVCQKNAWCDTEIFQRWYEEVFLNYEKSINKKCLLILDKSPSHYNQKIH